MSIKKENSGDTDLGRKLQEKADKAAEQKDIEALLKTDISGLDKEEAKKKLRDALYKDK